MLELRRQLKTLAGKSAMAERLREGKLGFLALKAKQGAETDDFKSSATFTAILGCNQKSSQGTFWPKSCTRKS